MDPKLFAAVFATVFVAELGDKTQLATLLFASGEHTPKWLVFAASASALVLTSALGVMAGSLISNYVGARALHYVAGAGFIAIGAWTLWKACHGGT